METIIHKRVELARQGKNPAVICKMPSGWAVLGDEQFLKGYSLLLPDPVVPHLNALDIPGREQFLADMTLLGDALLEVTGAVRINYEMLGNLEPALHAHVIPRYDDEPCERRTGSAFFYDWKAAPKFEPQVHGELLAAIRSGVEKRL